MNLLLSMPLELLSTVLGNLDWRDLVRCRQVCRSFRDYIDKNVSTQYKIELAVAGMEDGPPSLLTTSDRLRMLRERQAAWRSFKWKSEQEYPMLGDNVWEINGGVLAQADHEGLLTVTQLPSVIRGIEEKQWKIPDMGIPIRDKFTMDPAQDLLIVVETVRAGDLIHHRVHFRSLRTGAVHPAAKDGILEHSPLMGQHYTYTVQTAENLLGFHVKAVDREDHELLIWDWHTGALRMHLQDPDMSTFAFLSSRYILIPNYPNVELIRDNPDDYEGKYRIMIVDLETTPPRCTTLYDVPYLCSLMYPELAKENLQTGISIRSDPAHLGAALKVPFCTSRADRLFVLTLTCKDESDTYYTLHSLVPASTIFSAIAALGPTAVGAFVPWAAWGPAGSRLLRAPPMPSEPVPITCHVYGMQFAMALRARSRQVVWAVLADFNQLAARHRAPATSAGRQTAPKVWVCKADWHFFIEDVQTRLPFFHRQWTITGEEDAEGEEPSTVVMISEDSVILVLSHPNIRKYQVFTF